MYAYTFLFKAFAFHQRQSLSSRLLELASAPGAPPIGVRISGEFSEHLGKSFVIKFAKICNNLPVITPAASTKI